jgi:hypothetical protein
MVPVPTAVKARELRGTTGSSAASELSVSLTRKTLPSGIQWKEAEQLVTRCSEEEDLENCKESPVRGIDHSDSHCHRSIEEEYQPLFTKSKGHLLQKQSLNRVDEESSLPLED